MATHTSRSPQLLLTKHTFVCLTDNTLVFLDLHKDNYSCLEMQHTLQIAKLLGLPVAANETGEGAPPIKTISEDTAKVVQGLIDNGLATRDESKGKKAELIPQDTELKEMLGYFPGEGPKIRIGHIFNFFKALAVAKISRKILPIEYTVNRVKRRKESFYAKGGEEASYERINELVEIYKILKPLFVTVKDECLFNSLFLIEFLAHYQVYPSWYFGVRLNEFYAHCWVQNGSIIYDDFAQNTSQNKPIMAT